MNLFKKIYHFFDELEDKVRGKLSKRPIIYALMGSFGVVLIWRGIWTIADDFEMSGWASLVLGVFISLITGLFVSLFIGDKIIISGLKKEKRVDEKTKDEINKESLELESIKEELIEIKNEILKK